MEIVIMTIKNIIYSAHQILEQVANIPVKRSHVYELLAAAFGFNTYASLTSNAILIQSKRPRKVGTINLDLIQQRSEELGYENVFTTTLPTVMDDHQIGALTFADLVNELKNEDSLDEYDWDDDHSYQQVSPEVLRTLEAAAKTGNSLAHYAIALHYENRDESDEAGISNDYWYKQMQSGRELSAVEKEFALDYLQQLTSQKKYQFHLREAARLGCDLALLDLAEKFDDHTFFESDHRAIDVDPMKIAEIARMLGRSEDTLYWLMLAADAGHIGAMRELINSYEKVDPLRSWTWVYLSKLLGNDITQDHYEAIHDDGSYYDDDVGGNLHVIGEDGIDLLILESEQDSLARASAEALFNLMNTTN